MHKVRHLLDTQSLKSGGATRLTQSADAVSKRSLRAPGASSENITARTGARQFESFLRSISRIDSLLDARRLKNDILAEIRRTKDLIGTFLSLWI